jgi:hypothetical protein
MNFNKPNQTTKAQNKKVEALHSYLFEIKMLGYYRAKSEKNLHIPTAWAKPG